MTFRDEAAARLLPCVSSTYAPIGQTPIIDCESKNKAYVSISGVISPCGFAYFETRPVEGFKQNSLARFLDNAWAAAQQALPVVWDNASSHHSKTVKEYLSGQSSERPRIWLENIPAYSPELNPIEQVWSVLKQRLSNRFFKTLKDLRLAVTKELDKIKKDKELIISFFKNKHLECYRFFS